MFCICLGTSPMPAGAWVKKNSGSFRSKMLQKGGTMCQNNTTAPLGYQSILAIGDCLALDNPEWPGKTENRSFEVSGYTVSITVPHDVNIPSGIYINVYHNGFLVWNTKKEFYSVPYALEHFKESMKKAIQSTIQWIQYQ